MHFSSLLPTLGGLVAVAQASPHLLPGAASGGVGLGLGLDVDVSLGKGASVDLDHTKDVSLDHAEDVNLPTKEVESPVKGVVSPVKGLTKPLSGLGQKGSVTPASCSLANSWEDHVLFKGVAAPASGASGAVHLGLNLPKAQISGDAKLELVKDFLQEPRIRVGLGGVKAYVEIDISASAAVHESIELFASSALSLEIPGLEAEAGAALALDLVVGVDAAVDLSAGVYLAFGEEAFVEISLVTKEIVDVSLDGLVTKALPIGVAADADLSAEVALQLGLRLRTEIDLEGELDIPVLEIEAGAKVAVWVSLFEYTAALLATDDCAVSIDEVIALTLGLAVDLDVEVGDILDISLAPTLTVTLATAAKAKVCQDSRGSIGAFLEGSASSGSKTSTLVVSLATASAGDSKTTEGSDATGSDAYAVPEVTGSDAYPVGEETSAEGSAKPVTTEAPVVTLSPAGGNGTTGDVTRTLTSTHVYTVTSCAASVINCPARYTQKVVTSTIIESTYVCPATETGVVPALTTAHTKVPVPVTTITDTLTTVVPCKTRTTSTFKPPTAAPPAPTVTIVDTTTYCPESEKTGSPSKVPTTFQAVTTGAASTEVYKVPSSVVTTPEAPVTKPHEKPTAEVPTPEKPTGDKPIVPPVQSIHYPHGNGTVTTPVPVVPAPVPTAPGNTYVPPVVSNPPVVPNPPAVSNPPHPAYPVGPTAPGAPVVPTPVATPIGTPVPVSGGSVVRTSLMLAVPAVVALFM
ncbi:Ff.00g037660.m01.CDS01 [Fusarium sp. VM40]|nr:Ff.00g037660.m01.CDS01 [Fusarium sp. VM40]